MFEKFYTTKMSENGKMLKHRFNKIRTNVSKSARCVVYHTCGDSIGICLRSVPCRRGGYAGRALSGLRR